MEAIGAVLFFLDLLFFHLAFKAAKPAKWLWVGFFIVNVLGVLIIVLGVK